MRRLLLLTTLVLAPAQDPFAGVLRALDEERKQEACAGFCSLYEGASTGEKGRALGRGYDEFRRRGLVGLWLQALDQLANLNPTDVELRWSRVRVLWDLRLLTRARAALDDLATLAAGDPRLAEWGGWVAFLSFDHEEAGRSLKGPVGEHQQDLVRSLESARGRQLVTLILGCLALPIVALFAFKRFERWLSSL